MAEATQADACAMTEGTFCWNELMTRDPGKAKTFFTKLFGWTTEEKDMGPMGIYTCFKEGDVQKAGMMEMSGPQFEGVPSHWLGYINVDSVDKTTTKAEGLGAAVHVPPTDIPGIGRFSVIADPSGATVGLFQMG